jgi:hypothetical protein
MTDGRWWHLYVSTEYILLRSMQDVKENMASAPLQDCSSGKEAAS